MEVASATVAGTRRGMNEDRLAASRLGRGAGLAFALSDGMGGHEHGAACAQLAARAAERALRDGGLGVRGAFDRANEAVMRFKEEACAEDSGATLCVGAIGADLALRLCWSGDTVCFLLRDGRAELLTRPDVAAGGRLVNYLGKWHGLAPGYAEAGLREGDLLLAATDGAWSRVPGDEAARIVRGASCLADAAGRLAAEGSALTGDDATVFLVRVGRDGPA